MALAFSQAKDFVGATGQRAVSFDSLPSAGDLILVYAASAAGSGVLACTDNQGNVYRKVIDGPYINAWWCRTGSTSGTFTVTVGNGGYAHVSVGILAFSGADSDVGLTNISDNSGGGTTATPGSITTIIAETLLITSEGVQGYIAPINYTVRSSGGAFNMGVATRSITSTGSHNPSWTVTDGAWQCNILAFANGVYPIISGASITYASSRTRTGPNTTWGCTFTADDGDTTDADALSYELRTSATPGAGILVTSGTCTSGEEKAVTGLSYNASGLSQGVNALWLHISDGINISVSSQLQLNRDDSVSAPTGISHTPNPVGDDNQYSVVFTATDTYSTSANEMGYEIRTAASGGGSLLKSGNFTQGSDRNTGALTDSGLVNGATRYVRVHDGAYNIAEQSFTVNKASSSRCALLGVGV